MSMSVVHPEVQKNAVIKRRELFFNEIIAKMSMPPDTVDAIFCQKQYWVKPQKIAVNNAEMGNLMIEVEIGSCRFFYSVYQIGRRLCIGTLIDDTIFKNELREYFNEIWANASVAQSIRGQYVLLEWVFEEPELLQSWTIQEGYVLGMRHMHFRISTILQNLLACEDN